MDWSIAQINLLGEWLLFRLGRISIELIILALIIFGILWVVRIKSPAVRYWFCCLILVKPLATILIASPISLYWFLSPEPEKLPEPPPAIEQYVAVERLPSMDYSHRPDFQRAGYRSNLPVPPPTPWWKELNIDSYITFTWLAIMIVFGIRLFAGCVYVHLLCARAKELPPGPERELLDRARKLMNMSRKVRVAVSSQVATPILAGIFRPLILMPEGFRENLSQRQIEMIFAHELGHIKRWDNLVLLLQRITEMFLFYHPVVWICGHVLRTEAEKACDDLVLANYGNGAEYAASLASAAEMRDKLTRRLLINTFAASESSLTMRVKRILEGRRGKTMLWISVLTVFALLAVAVFGLPSAAIRENNKEKDDTMIKVKTDGSKTYLDGVVPEKTVWLCQWDAILRGVQVILKARGASTSLNELMAYSGDAFNLCHGSNWQGVAYLQIPTNPVKNITDVYGYEYTCLHDGYGVEKFNKMQPEERKKFTEAILRKIAGEIDAGRPVLAGGCIDGCGDWLVITGYDTQKPALRYFKANGKPAWDVVRGFPGNPAYADDSGRDVIGHWNGRFRGTIRPNFTGCWQNNPAYLIGKKTSAPTEKENILNALKRAIEVFNASKHHISWWGGVDYYFGRQAYEKWAEELHQLDYPADLKKQLPKDAYDWYEMGNMDTQVDQIIRGRTAAAEFCLKAAKLFPELKSCLEKAAENYKKEVAIAKKEFAVFIPPWDNKDPKRKAWLSSKTKREQGVRAISEMLKYDQAAIGEIETALKAEGVEVKNIKTVEKKIIAGVPVISWKKTGDCSFAAALAAALTPTKHPYSYTDIMGYSALAFRVRWRGEKNHKNKAWWCGSIPVGEFKEEVERTAGMTGWQLDCTGMLENNPEKLKEYFPEVIKSVNDGLPVLGYPTGKNLNCAVIYGYEVKNGKPEFYWRDLFKGDKEYLQPAKDSGPFLIFLKSWKRPAAKKARFADSLKQAVVNWSREPIGTPKYYTWSYGKEAMELWIKDLRNAARFSKEQQQELFFVNAWNFTTLRDARKHAVKYLVGNAKLLPEPSRKHLEKAAELYRQEVKVLESTPGAFRGPMGGKKLEEWTPADRKCEAGILSDAFKLEQQAIAELAQALKAAGIELKNIKAVDKNYAKKMLRWQNIFGWTLEKCEKGVAEHQEIQKLNKLETSIELLSSQAASVRQRMLGLEPAMTGYRSNVEALLEAIGKRKLLKKLPFKGLSEQQKKIREYIKVLKLWLAGVDETKVTTTKGIPLECITNVYNYLGDNRDKEKRQLVELLVQSLEKEVDKKTADKLKKSEKLKEIIHRIENPGKNLWSFENNFRLLTKSIGQEKPVGEWHKPGGPLCWSDGNPEDLKPLKETIKNLKAWIAGKPVPEAFAKQMGKPGAYKEKLWLAKSLLVYLKNNQQNYYKPDFAVSPHDFSKLKPGWSMDAFAQAVYESAKLLGKRPDLLTMQAMTTNAFAPAVNPEENCSAWWHVQSLDRGRKLVEDRFGLKIAPLKTKVPEKIPPKPEDPEKKQEWLAKYYRKPFIKEIQQHLKAGNLVIVDMVWDWKHHGNAWVNWGIVTEANDDGTIKGTGVNGRIDNPLLFVHQGYVISPGKVELTPKQADLEMLKLAVLRINGENHPFQPTPETIYRGEKAAQFGVKAMDEWINRMKTVPGFCIPCEKVKRGWSCAEACAIPLSAGAKNAAAYLKKRLNSFPVKMRAHLRKAAAHYENIAKLLAPALDKKAKTHYRHFVGNLKKQQAYASSVLEKVKEELAAAGNDIELALQSEGI